MRAIFILLTMCCSLAGAQSPHDTLDALHESASLADADRYFALFRADARFLGTDRHERWTLRRFEALYRPVMEGGRGWTYHPRDRHVEILGDIAWFDETLWHETYGHSRGSGVLVKEGDAWLIAQYNLVFPVPNDIAQEAVALSLEHEHARLRAMTFNIRYDNAGDGEHAWPKRSTDVPALIRAEAPDVVGVQEALAHQVRAIEEALPGYVRVGVGRGDGVAEGEFSPIYVLADRFEISESGTFWFSDTPSEPGSTSYGNSIPRICTWAVVRDKARDETLLVCNVHLDHASPESRSASIAQLASWIDSQEARRVVVMGDFNTSPTSDAAAALVGEYEIAAPEIGTYHAFRGPPGENEVAIDWLAERGDLDLISVRALRDESRLGGGRWVSDHYPVIATYEWPG